MHPFVCAQEPGHPLPLYATMSGSTASLTGDGNKQPEQNLGLSYKGNSSPYRVVNTLFLLLTQPDVRRDRAPREKFARRGGLNVGTIPSYLSTSGRTAAP